MGSLVGVSAMSAPLDGIGTVLSHPRQNRCELIWLNVARRALYVPEGPPLQLGIMPSGGLALLRRSRDATDSYSAPTSHPHCSRGAAAVGPRRLHQHQHQPAPTFALSTTHRIPAKQS